METIAVLDVTTVPGTRPRSEAWRAVAPTAYRTTGDTCPRPAADQPCATRAGNPTGTAGVVVKGAVVGHAHGMRAAAQPSVQLVQLVALQGTRPRGAPV